MAESGGREQLQRIPAVPPTVADVAVCIHNDEVTATSAQVEGRGQAGLAAADDDGFDTLFWNRLLPSGFATVRQCLS